LFLEVIMGDHHEIEAAVAKSFKSTTILKFVLALCWVAISFTLSASKHPRFDQVFTSQAILEEIAATTSLTFAPGLFDLLRSHTAPTVADFKKLPTNVLPTRLSKIWGVYLVVLEKPD
jgi:hypothetical protein